jgi:phosphonopyruvate decarboxylase
MKAKEFTELLLENKFNFITGVPDSLFKDALVDINTRPEFKHIISNNEGEACALAAGYHLSTGQFPVVYMQNSGLGNSLNPLTSLLDSNIYSIPILLFITWRGRPGTKDEPQHIRMGAILPELLCLLGIPFQIASDNVVSMKIMLETAKNHLTINQYPYAIIFPNDVIENASSKEKQYIDYSLKFTREKVLEHIIRFSNDNDVIITTTGKTSRELFEIREKNQQGHQQDFLTVGSMGCASAVAFGIAVGQPERRIILIDGDGACLMRLETMVLIGHYKPAHLLHIVIDNNVYESTGSQKTLSDTTDFVRFAHACQYAEAVMVDNIEDLKRECSHLSSGPKLVRIKVVNYSRNNLGRPKTTPLENKYHFMTFLANKQKEKV